MSKLLLAIPVLIDNEKRLTDALKSVSNQTLFKSGNVDVHVLINNPRDESILEQLDEFEDVYATINDYNFGVSGSWNQAIIEALNQGNEYAMCMGFDVSIDDENMLEDAVNNMDKTSSVFGRGKHMSYNFWMCRPEELVSKVGLFDENFYPGYWEDLDMARRLRSLRDRGIITTCLFDDENKISHAQSRTINDHNSVIPHAVWNYTYTQNQLYFRSKWGTDKDDHNVGFKFPFNNPRHHLSFWVLDVKRYELHKKRWEDCLNAQ